MHDIPPVGVGTRSAEPAWPPVIGRLRVGLVPDLASIGPGLELVSRGRIRCVPRLRDADVALTSPHSPGTIHGLRRRLRPSVPLVVVDRRGACAPPLIVDMIEGGAATVVSSANLKVLVAHIDALARRLPTAARRRRRAGQA